jgi:hypothetical protein
VDIDDLLFGSNWWRDGQDGHPGAQGRARMNIVQAFERDVRRMRERNAAPVAPMRWRFHAGSWQRWSELDRAFATLEPPGTLVEHAAAGGGPVEDVELVFVDGRWLEADDVLAPADEPDVPDVPDVQAAPPVVDDGGAVSFEQQIEAWRQRR